MFIFRRLFEKNFLSKIPHEVEANLSRLAAQWEDKINRTIEEMRKQALTYVQEELTTIDALLSRTQGQSGEISKVIFELQKKSEFLAR
jgi:glutamyl-tRNA reductase